jgi:serine/threonine-protein kinase mTOR
MTITEVGYCIVQFVAIAQAGAQAGVSKDLMDKAQDVMIRMLNKLEGKDFRTDRPSALSTLDQVQKLILRATSNELLCQSYIGWCPFW